MSDDAVIRERGYSGYDGPRLVGRSAYTLGAHTVATLLRRTGSRRAIALSSLSAIIAGVVVYLESKVGSGVGGATYPIFLLTNPAGVVMPALFIALIAAGGTIAEDRRTGALPFYFARPLLARDYLLGRLGGVYVAMLVTVAAPPTALALYRALLCNHLGEALRALGLAALIAVLSAMVALAVSIYALLGGALSGSRGAAQSFIGVAFVLPWILAGVGAKVLDGPWVSLLSIPHLVESIGDPLTLALGGSGKSLIEVVVEGLSERPHDPHLPPLVAALALAVIITAGYLLLRSRVAGFARNGGDAGRGA